MILGTLQYIAPEQLEGKEADHRTDIFAFGALVYEMATGQRAFSGESQASLIAPILEHEPVPMSTLQQMTPARLDEIVKTCLAKDPNDRWQSAGDLGRQVGWIVRDPSQPGETIEVETPRRVRGSYGVLPTLAALAVGSIVAGGTVWTVMRSAPPEVTTRSSIDLAPGVQLVPNGFDLDLALSPDGTQLVYLGTGEDQTFLYARPFDTLESTPLAGAALAPRNPFFSPDGNWVAYFEGYSLMKVPSRGGPPQTITSVAGAPRGASWGSGDTIIFATDGPDGLWRVSAQGDDEPELLTVPDSARGEEDHRWPEILPGGESVLFTVIAGGGAIENGQIAVLSIANGTYETLIPGGSNPRYVPTGHIIYGAEGTLRAVRFDLDHLAVTGDPVAVVAGVNTKGTGAANFGVSPDGSLVYVSGAASGSESAVVWVDRQGRETPVPDIPRGVYSSVRVSPNGSQLALTRLAGGNSDVVVYDFARRNLSRVTTDLAADTFPLWTLDGDRIVFSSHREGPQKLYIKRADGTGTVEHILTRENTTSLFAWSWSPEGDRLVFSEGPAPGGYNLDLGVLSMDDGTVQPLINTEFRELYAEVSPNGRWVAYVSTRSGQPDVYLDTFPILSNQLLISGQGGREPIWSQDGRTLFYRSPDGRQVFEVPIDTAQNPIAGNPEKLFEGRFLVASGVRSFDVGPEEGSFVMLSQRTTEQGESPPAIIWVQNWFDELQRLVPSP